MSQKLLYLGRSHHKININVHLGLKLLNIETTDKFNEASVIFSPKTFVNPIDYPNKKFINCGFI